MDCIHSLTYLLACNATYRNPGQRYRLPPLGVSDLSFFPVACFEVRIRAPAPRIRNYRYPPKTNPSKGREGLLQILTCRAPLGRSSAAVTAGAAATDRLAFLARSLTGTDIITSRHNSRCEAEMRVLPGFKAGKALVGAEDGGGGGERAR